VEGWLLTVCMRMHVYYVCMYVCMYMWRAGAKFTRSVMLGMMQQELWVRLAEDDGAVVWRTVNSSSTDSGTIDVKDIHKCACSAPRGCLPTD